MNTNRRHFTKHGFHTNSSGKEWFAKLAATQIEMLIKSTNKSESAIPLNWKEETTTLNIASDNTRCDPKVFSQVVLKQYCALRLAADTITTQYYTSCNT